MYNYYQQPSPIPSYNRGSNLYSSSVLKGHQVASLDEVKAATIDFDGSVFYFPDLANQRIYSKAINPMDGTASINMYKLVPLPTEMPVSGDFITRQEFETAIAELTKTLQQQQQQQQQQNATPSINYKEAF